MTMTPSIVTNDTLWMTTPTNIDWFASFDLSKDLLLSVLENLVLELLALGLEANLTLLLKLETSEIVGHSLDLLVESVVARQIVLVGDVDGTWSGCQRTSAGGTGAPG